MAELEDQARKEFDNFLYKKGSSPTKLHLPAERRLKKTQCQEKTGKEFEFVIKPVNAYPKGYREICENCMIEWSENND